MGWTVDKSFVTHAGSQGLYCWPYVVLPQLPLGEPFMLNLRKHSGSALDAFLPQMPVHWSSREGQRPLKQ